MDPVVDSSGWFAAQLRYAYLLGEPGRLDVYEDRVVLVDADDEDAALALAVEVAPEYENEYDNAEGELVTIRFEGIVALKELDDAPASGIEVWHEFKAPPGSAGAARLPAASPEELAFPRARDD